ncbi:MAG TPA: anti-sigma factor [Gaiellaceae bacterium]|nr:anti-sigma factor [Gaiellaceae bacterium]
MEPGTVHDLTAAYALDALAADEAEVYEAHLAQCERCREELASLTDTAGALAWAVDAPPPPARLREAILGAAAAERENVVPLRPRALPFRLVSAAAAVAACVAVGVGVWAATLSHSLSRERAARASDATAVEILADDASRRASLSGGSGVVAVDPTGQAVLVVRRLPAAPSGKTYEAWVIPHGGSPVPAGTFAGGGGTSVVRLRATVPQGAVVAATVERAGGVQAPTTTPIFSATT